MEVLCVKRLKEDCEFGQVFLQLYCEIEQMSFHRHFCFVRSFNTFFLVSLYGPFFPCTVFGHSSGGGGVYSYSSDTVEGPRAPAVKLTGPGAPIGITRLGSPASPRKVPVDAVACRAFSRSGGSKPLLSPKSRRGVPSSPRWATQWMGSVGNPCDSSLAPHHP